MEEERWGREEKRKKEERNASQPPSTTKNKYSQIKLLHPFPADLSQSSTSMP
jgi:hypothetical protein